MPEEMLKLLLGGAWIVANLVNAFHFSLYPISFLFINIKN